MIGWLKSKLLIEILILSNVFLGAKSSNNNGKCFSIFSNENMNIAFLNLTKFI